MASGYPPVEFEQQGYNPNQASAPPYPSQQGGQQGEQDRGLGSMAAAALGGMMHQGGQGHAPTMPGGYPPPQGGYPSQQHSGYGAPPGYPGGGGGGYGAPPGYPPSAGGDYGGPPHGQQGYAQPGGYPQQQQGGHGMNPMMAAGAGAAAAGLAGYAYEQYQHGHQHSHGMPQGGPHIGGFDPYQAQHGGYPPQMQHGKHKKGKHKKDKHHHKGGSGSSSSDSD